MPGIHRSASRGRPAVTRATTSAASVAVRQGDVQRAAPRSSDSFVECDAWYNEPMTHATLLLIILAFAGVCGSPPVARGETPAPLVLLVATDRPSYAQGDTATIT